MGNLGFFERLKYSKLFSGEVGGIAFRVWVSMRNTNICKAQTPKKIKQLIVTSLSKIRKLTDRIKDVDIILRVLVRDLDWKKNMAAAIAAEFNSLGRVRMGDMVSSRNIIYLDIDDLQTNANKKTYDNYWARLRADGMPDSQIHDSMEDFVEIILDDALRKFEESFEETLSHELMHLWHSKENEIFRRLQWFEGRRTKVRKSIKQQINDARKNTAAESGSNTRFMKKALLGYWTTRADFERVLKIDMHLEGIAEFGRLYLANTCQEDFLRGQAEEYARNGKKLLDKATEGYELLFRSKRSDTDSIKAAENAINSAVQKLEQVPYRVGPIIPGLLVLHGKRTIQEAMRLRQTELVREYCAECRKMGILPVYSMDAGEPAILNIRDELLRFNKLRKKYNIR